MCVCVFCALTTDGQVICWGAKDRGGDTSGVDKQLSQVKVVQVFSTSDAFCAVTTDGQVICWGRKNFLFCFYAFDNFRKKKKISEVKVAQVFSTNGAFCALTTDGQVICWGNKSYGGDSADVDIKFQVN